MSDGYHLWSDTYDRNLDDIFAVQEDISRQVVGALKVTLLGEDESELAGRPTKNIEAYELYLLGRHHLNEGGVAAYEKAVGYFTQAIELDSNYALAYTGLADSYIDQFRVGNLPRREVLPRAESAARKALALDDKLAQAHTSLGQVKRWQFNDNTGAMSEFQRAIELNPNYMPAYSGYADMLTIMGRWKDAQTILEQALEIDPLSEEIIEFSNENLRFMGRFEESKHRHFLDYWMYGHLDIALRDQKKAVELYPENSVGHAWLALIYIDLGEYKLAEKSIARARELAPEKIILGEREEDYLYLARGRYTQYLQFTYDRLNKNPRYISKVRTAFAEMMVGNYEKALILYDRVRLADKDVDSLWGLGPWDISVYGRSDLVYMAKAYFKTGDAESGNKLLAESQAYLEKQREQGLGTPQSYYFEASLNALGGNKQEALSSLRKAIDLGWRESWRMVRAPTLELLRDTPEFKEMMAEVEADIARQRRQLKQEGLLE